MSSVTVYTNLKKDDVTFQRLPLWSSFQRLLIARRCFILSFIFPSSVSSVPLIQSGTRHPIFQKTNKRSKVSRAGSRVVDCRSTTIQFASAKRTWAFRGPFAERLKLRKAEVGQFIRAHSCRCAAFTNKFWCSRINSGSVTDSAT